MHIVGVRNSIERYCKFGPKTVAEVREIMDENQPHAPRAALLSFPHNQKLIEEPDLLSLVFNARSPYKLEFQKFLPKLRSYGFYAMPGAISPQPNQQAIGYQRQPHELEYADCVREGIEGTPESKLGRRKEKMTECEPLKDPQKQEWGKLGPPVAKRNRQLLKEKVIKLTSENTELLEQIEDYREANEGLGQTIKDMNNWHFEWRQRIENEHKNVVEKLKALIRPEDLPLPPPNEGL